MAEFQHAAARRRLDSGGTFKGDQFGFNTQPPEGGWGWVARGTCGSSSFNTQPPEGGWRPILGRLIVASGFNTQPPEGGWPRLSASSIRNYHVSTHSRLKAAGAILYPSKQNNQGFNTQPPEGGWQLRPRTRLGIQSFNTQPPEGGWLVAEMFSRHFRVSTHSRLKAAGASLKSLAPSGLAAPISLGSQEKREREYNTAFSVTPAFAIS